MLLSSKPAHSFGVEAEAGPDRPCVTLNLRLKAELQLCSVSSLDPTRSSPSCHFFWPSPEGRLVCRRPRGWTLLTPADWWLGALLPARLPDLCLLQRISLFSAASLGVCPGFLTPGGVFFISQRSFLFFLLLFYLFILDSSCPPLTSGSFGFSVLNVLTNVFSFTFYMYNNCKTHKGFLLSLT